MELLLWIRMMPVPWNEMCFMELNTNSFAVFLEPVDDFFLLWTNHRCVHFGHLFSLGNIFQLPPKDTSQRKSHGCWSLCHNTTSRDYHSMSCNSKYRKMMEESGKTQKHPVKMCTRQWLCKRYWKASSKQCHLFLVFRTHMMRSEQ